MCLRRSVGKVVALTAAEFSLCWREVQLGDAPVAVWRGTEEPLLNRGVVRLSGLAERDVVSV